MKIKVTREDLDLALEAAKREAYRTNSKVVIHWDRIVLVDAPLPNGANGEASALPDDR